MARDSGRDIRKLSKTQIDRLGDRLRKGDVSDTDLQILDGYRRMFSEAYDKVVRAIRDEMGMEPTGRPAKSTTSISEKLRRESIRLTQIQDIAGCRLVVTGVAEQIIVVDRLKRLFDKVSVVDRREHPSYGYRAVHIIVTLDRKLIEIQVRTSLQHLWAELSEKWADISDPAIKYGGGDEQIRVLLLEASALIAEAESWEHRLIAALPDIPPGQVLPEDLKPQVAEILQQISSMKHRMAVTLQNAIDQTLEAKRDLSN